MQWKFFANRRHRAQAMCPGNLVDENHVIAMEPRQIDSFACRLGQRLEIGMRSLNNVDPQAIGESEDITPQPNAPGIAARLQQLFLYQCGDDPLDRRTRQSGLPCDVAETQTRTQIAAGAQD